VLIALCIVVAHGRAMAQSAEASFQDALTPKLQTSPRNPPRFQKLDGTARANLAGPAAFTPAGSGAGTTGFDSTNSRKTRAKAKPKATADAQAVAPGLPAAAVAPYGARADVTGSVAAGAPGRPPVEMGPIRTFPQKRKAHTEPEDPYAPLGIRAGAFDLFPAIEFIGGHDSDPARTQTRKSAWLYVIAPELRAQSNWSRHELKADLRGSYTGYSPDETPSLSRPYLNGKVDGRIDITHEARIDAGGRILVSTDNPGSPNLQAGLSRLPIFTTAGGTIGLGQRFNRFDVSIKGDVERTIFQPSSLTDGTTASNDDRKYDQYTGTLRASYELSPGLTPFSEFAADSRVHDLETDSSGFQRDSNGLTGKVGAKFELTRLVTGEAAIGYVQRVYADPRLENLNGLIGDASLIWTANALTTVKLTGRSTVGESTVPGVSGVLYRDVGLQADHSFRRWLVGSLKFGFGVDDYFGDGRIDKRYSAGAGLAYKLNRSVQVKGEFRRDWLQSNVSGASYTASVVMLGLRLQR
jgi:hypothetical protein